MKIEDMSDEALLELWEQSKLSTRRFAKKHGVTVGIIAGKIHRAREKQKETFTAEETPNRKTVYSKSIRIKNLDDLIAVCEIDLNEWIVERHIVNKWEVGRRDEKVDLSFNHGAITGKKKDSGRIFVEPLYQVKAWLIKREPEPVIPIIKPVISVIKNYKTGQPKASTKESLLIIPDAQIGFNKIDGRLHTFHDRKAMSIALVLCQMLQFDAIVIVGDYGDFAEWTDKFLIDPNSHQTTQPTLIEGNWYLSKLRQYQPKARIIYIEGNHDKRVEIAIKKYLPFAYGLKPANEIHLPAPLTIPRLFGLAELDIEYEGNYPNGETWISDSLKCIHGNVAKTDPGATARAYLRDANETIVFGHDHTFQYLAKDIKGRNGSRVVYSYCPGVVCKVDNSVPGKTNRQTWTQGIGVAHYDNKQTYIEHIPISNGRAMFRGEFIEGYDYENEIILE